MRTQPGEAGASAQREYDLRKLADVKASLDKSLGDVRSALNPEPQATRAWAEGAIGERKLDAVLKSMRGLRVLSDRKVGRANIDFIVVGRSGVCCRRQALQGRHHLPRRWRRSSARPPPLCQQPGSLAPRW